MNTEIKKKFEEIFKNSTKENILENFAMYGKFLIESAGDIFFDDIVSGILDAIGPIEIEDEDIFLQNLDLEVQGIQDLAEYLKDFIKQNPETKIEIKDLDESAKVKWENLKEKFEKLFEKVVSENKKEIFKKIIKN